MNSLLARDMRRLPAAERTRIFTALDRMVDEPFAGDVQKLGGRENDWRLCVGPWRIRFEMQPETRTVAVYAVRRRPDAYRD